MRHASLHSSGQAGPPLSLHAAFGFRARLLGLHAFPVLAPNQGLWLSPCNAVHSIGLAYAIDVVFLDHRHRVIRRVERLAPNRAAFCLAARSVVELPAGYCAGQPDYRWKIRQALCRIKRPS